MNCGWGQKVGDKVCVLRINYIYGHRQRIFLWCCPKSRGFYSCFGGFGHRVKKKCNLCPHFGDFVGIRQVNLLCDAQNGLFKRDKIQVLGIGAGKKPFMPILNKSAVFHMHCRWLRTSPNDSCFLILYIFSSVNTISQKEKQNFTK